MYRTNTLTRTIARLTVTLALVVLWTAAAQAQYGGGGGTAEDPYLIHTPEQMNEIGLHHEHWSSHFTLMADLDLSAYQGESFNLIGYYSAEERGHFNKGFSGVFDGNGHTISNFTYLVDANQPGIFTEYGWPESPWEAVFGLFRIVWPSGVIKNLGLIEPMVQPMPDSTEWVRHVGALVGQNNGTIANCYVEGGRVAADAFVGGLVGYCLGSSTITDCRASCNVAYSAGRTLRQSMLSESSPSYFGGLVGYTEGEIRNCYVTGSVWGDVYVGGLAGHNDTLNSVGLIVNCFATGPVSGHYSVGGLVGESMGHIHSCYATGRVSGNQRVGGLAGSISDVEFYFGDDGEDAVTEVEHCYAIGPVSGHDDVGGLAGAQGRDCIISGCFWDLETTGQEDSPGGGTGQDTVQMQDLAAYIDAGWDFLGESDNGTDEIWTMDGGEPIYPRLTWELADANDPNGTQIGPDASEVYESVIIYETTLDTDPGWTTDGQWQFGPPAGQGANEYGFPDPNGGYTGDNVYGVNLDGDYALVADGPHHLTIGPFDCSDYRDVEITFARWLNTDQADFVRAAAEYSDDGVYWIPLWEHTDMDAEFTEDTWTVVQRHASLADGQREVWFRWSYEVFDVEAWAFSGWNIDDIVISGQQKVQQTQ